VGGVNPVRIGGNQVGYGTGSDAFDTPIVRSYNSPRLPESVMHVGIRTQTMAIACVSA
jgi:hypothetical protein